MVLRTSKVEAAESLQCESDIGNVTLGHGDLRGDIGCSVEGGLGSARVAHLLMQQDHIQHLQQIV